MHERASVAVSPSGGAAISSSHHPPPCVTACLKPTNKAQSPAMTEPPQPRKRRALTYTEMMNSGMQQPAVEPTEAMEQKKPQPPTSTRDADQNGKEC